MAHLRPCTGCARHVRANTTTCPFCDASLMIEDVEPAVPQERLGRAARMAFNGAAVMAMTVAVGCGKDNKENIAMPYGAPPTPTPMVSESATAPQLGDAQASLPVAVSPDASAPADAASPDASVADAGKKKVTPPAPTLAPAPTKRSHENMNKPYGAPPADGFDLFEV